MLKVPGNGEPFVLSVFQPNGTLVFSKVIPADGSNERSFKLPVKGLYIVRLSSDKGMDVRQKILTY